MYLFNCYIKISIYLFGLSSYSRTSNSYEIIRIELHIYSVSGRYDTINHLDAVEIFHG